MDRHWSLVAATLVATLSWLAIARIARRARRPRGTTPWYLRVAEFGVALIALGGLLQLVVYAAVA